MTDINNQKQEELREAVAELFYGGKIPKVVDWDSFDSYHDWEVAVIRAYQMADKAIAMFKKSYPNYPIGG